MGQRHLFTIAIFSFSVRSLSSQTKPKQAHPVACFEFDISLRRSPNIALSTVPSYLILQAMCNCRNHQFAWEVCCIGDFSTTCIAGRRFIGFGNFLRKQLVDGPIGKMQDQISSLHVRKADAWPEPHVEGGIGARLGSGKISIRLPCFHQCRPHPNISSVGGAYVPVSI
jgi:hypothetical protein